MLEVVVVEVGEGVCSSLKPVVTEYVIVIGMDTADR
jgi:hypothetical protein